MLDFPKIDPHGEPISDNEGKGEPSLFEKLNACKEGETVTLRAVAVSSSDTICDRLLVEKK